MHLKTNISAVVSHVRRHSDTIFKVKVMVTVRFTHLGLNCQAAAAVSVETYWSFQSTGTLWCGRRH